MSTPRYSILPSKKDGVTRYLFRDHREPTPETIAKATTYGMTVMYYADGFFIENAADAVRFCQLLNHQDAQKGGQS